MTNCKELGKLPLGSIVLVVVSIKKYMQTNNEILKMLCNEKKCHGIYISVNRPYKNLLKILKENNIDVKKLFFIDAITKTAGGSEKKDSYLLVGSPQALTEISITLGQVAKSIPDKHKFLFLDSISTLLMYNQDKVVAKFVHSLTTKLREWEMGGVLLTMKKETDEKMISLLNQFSDKLISVNGGE